MLKTCPFWERAYVYFADCICHKFKSIGILYITLPEVLYNEVRELRRECNDIFAKMKNIALRSNMPLEEIQKGICKCFQVHSEFKKKINSTPNITEILKLLEGYGNTILNTQSLDALIEAFKMNELHYLVKKKKAFNSKVFRSSEMLPFKLLKNAKIDMSQVRSVKCIANDSKAVIEGILIDISVLVIESFRLNYGIKATVDVPGLYTIHVFSTGVSTIAIVLAPHSILNAVAGCPSSDPVPKV